MRTFLASFGLALALAGCSSAHEPAPGPIIPADRVVALLPNPVDGGTVDWDNWARTFFGDYCTSCHNPSAACTGSTCHNAADLPDFRNQADVVKLGPMIRCGISVHQEATWNCGSTAPESFPLLAPDNFFPTDEQRAIVADWITQGAH
jgi:hypothetical protein